VCYHYWSAILAHHCEAAEKIIRHAVKIDSATYFDLRKLNERWDKKLKKWYAAHPG
jgi:hypothetical protein